MRALVAAVGALALAGCAASTPPPAAAPHPILAQATPAASDARPGEPTTSEASAKDDHQTRQVNRAWGWVALSLGADGLILATITSFMMLHENSVRSANCVDKVCSPDGIAANGKLHDLAGWNAGAWVVAVAGGVTGTYLILTNPSDKALGTQIVMGPTASGSGLLLRGSF
ncbi:MAG: hypothetical protein ABSE49_24025 [Polyangiaceae bacterium]|jgi:hypothetical protein